MSRVVAVSIACVFTFCSPLAAVADSLVPLAPQPEQLLAREAFLKSAADGTPVACIVRTSTSAVQVNEPFHLWWGSYGAIGGGWRPVGSYTIAASVKGIYEYKLTFQGSGGSVATCRTTVTVS
jgi:hypothetical protein